MSGHPPAPIASQPPGEVFPWPANQPLTALDGATLALPAGLLGSGDAMSSVIHGPDEMDFAAPPGDLIYLRLSVGMTVHLTKPAQAYVVADAPDDKAPRRFQIGSPLRGS